MKSNKIIIFGATGKIGAEVIKLLSEAKLETVAVTRHLKKAVKLPFVEWIEADMADKESLIKPLSKGKVVFLLSGLSKDFVKEQMNVVEVAKQLEIKHIVKLSSGAADKESPFYIPRIHGEVESFIKEIKINWTMLQPNGIMQNWLLDTAESVRRERKIFEATGEGKRSHVDRRDIAEVAVKILTKPENHINKTYFLTADKAVNYFEIADIISNTIHEKVTFIPLDINDVRKQMEEANVPDFLIDTFISYDIAQHNGKAEVITNHAKEILGKPARTVEQFMKDYIKEFQQ